MSDTNYYERRHIRIGRVIDSVYNANDVRIQNITISDDDTQRKDWTRVDMGIVVMHKDNDE